MKSKLVVTIVFQLLNNCTTDNLLCTHSLGSSAKMLDLLGEVLPSRFVYDRHIVEDATAALQFKGSWRDTNSDVRKTVQRKYFGKCRVN